MGCPSNPPPPAGFRIWRGPVLTELTQWAMDLRDHVARFPYGQTWLLDYGGHNVLARKDYHTWTHRGGQLVTGICIPGITLYTSAPAGVGIGALPQPGPGGAPSSTDDPATMAPDPDVAVWGAPDDAGTDWGLVAITAAAVLTLGGLFYFGLKKF